MKVQKLNFLLLFFVSFLMLLCGGLLFSANALDKSVNNLVSSQEITIQSLTPINREYDGTKVVSFDTTYDGSLGDGLQIVATGEVDSADAGEGKLVKNINVEIVGEGKENYSINIDDSLKNNKSVNISRKKVEVEWNIEGELVYNGENLQNKIIPSYQDANSVKRTILFTASGNNFLGMSIPREELLITAGNYTLTPLGTENDKNYDFTSELGRAKTKSLTIKRKAPVLTFKKNIFYYTGEEIDLLDYVELENNEQILNVSGPHTFTTYNEGRALQGNVSFYAKATKNYTELFTTKYDFEVKKAETSINFENLKRDYTFSGGVQQIDLSGVTTNNRESQVVAYLSSEESDWAEFKNAGKYVVELQVAESDNYTFCKTDKIEINISRQKIDVSKFTWTGMSIFTYSLENNKAKSFKIEILNSDTSFTPHYTGNEASEAGNYTASVSYTPNDDRNYEIVGETPSKNWQIKKMEIAAPKVAGENSFEYNKEEHSINFDNILYKFVKVEGDITKTNAGKYTAKLILLDEKNTEWQGKNSSSAIDVKWEITRQVVSLPSYKKVVQYNGGKETGLGLETSDLYDVINGKASMAGEYVCYVVLKDIDNYQFEGGKNVLQINWRIAGDGSYEIVPPALIVFGMIVLFGLAIYLTFEFTYVRRRKTKEVMWTNKDAKPNEESVIKQTFSKESENLQFDIIENSTSGENKEKQEKVKRPRGRPKKEKTEEKEKRPRGRPKKEKIEEKVKRPRGRPKKEVKESDLKEKRPRGRPKKVKAE